jgi:hypothetical protein
MHFRLPKPLHGWREFAGEVGIIVVGVLIALGAEQVVETFNWHERAQHARQALMPELTTHYDEAVEWRTVEPCIASQLDILEKRLLASADRNDPAPTFTERGLTFVLRAPSRPYASAVWQSVLAEGVSSHLTEKERFDLGIYYQQLHDIDDLDKQLTASVTRLYSLSRPIPLDASARLSLLQSTDDIRDANQWMGIMTSQLVALLVDMNMRPADRLAKDYLATSATVAFCREHRLPLRPFAEAVKPA